MFWKLSANSNTDRILLISLSNIGDVVMTFPVFDTLREAFPQAEISVLVGPKARSFFDANPEVHQTVVYNKQMSVREKLAWFSDLRCQRFDLVVDLRNSMLPFLLNTRTMTRPAFITERQHMKDKHLRRLHEVLSDVVYPKDKHAVFLSAQELQSVDRLVKHLSDYVLFAPGAADHRKRWNEAGFTQAIRHVIDCCGRKVVVVGDERDRPQVERILKDIPDGVINVCGATTLLELSGVIKRAALAVTNDSGIMHLASYFDIPTLALFGPTDPFFYGPWSSQKDVIRKGTTMTNIAVADVIAVLDQRLGQKGFSRG